MAKNINKFLFRQAQRYIAGGVNSPIRSFRAVEAEPIFIKSARGSKIYSEDGRRFVDYCQSYGALILGHAHPKVIQELKKAIAKGTTFAAPTKKETELAKLIIEAIPSIERVRLTNSGTEAVMSAIRLARAFTKKNKIIKFEGSYHGHADYLLDCPGVPGDFKKHTVIAPYNNIEKTSQIISRYKNDIAAIIVEPVAANMGVVVPRLTFLQALRNLCDKYKIVLIFDEVVTGFRLCYGAAQNLFNIKADLTCLGKIIGGGLPCAAYGGRKEIMKLVAPEGRVYQAGTLAGNPVAVSAGLATLKALKEDNPFEALEKKTELLCKNIILSAGKNKIKLQINYIGSIFSIFFTGQEVTDYKTAKLQNTTFFKRFFQRLLNEGVYFSPSGFEANFLSTAHIPVDIENTLNAVDKALKILRRQ